MLKQLITTFFVTLLATGVFGQTSNVEASFSNGTLTLSGSGAMQDYESGEARPWEAYKDQITTIVIVLDGGNITSIGNYAFSNLKNLKSVEITGNKAQKYHR